ncbi:MAG: N-acetyltransferase [candidate division WOR-3 bacterium]|uniref:N-acetyltransferase n=1 Tax=candidate division WOR-3 bacterium TaxID=2052148 RepID=A0A7C3IWJ7_UNCW3|nr:N-acetyltransferase [candidate division WOR-3 bacterium]
MSGLTVRPVTTAAELDRFVRLPFALYRNDPYWVPPLLSDVKRTLTPGQNPFWSHAERRLFLAERNGQPAGRICATVDRNYNQYHQTAIGFFGFFECENSLETARALFQAVREYLRQAGMKLIYGPANPSLNDEAGLLVQPFEGMPYIKMSYNPAYYSALIEACGFTKVKDLYAYAVPLDQPIPEKLQRVLNALKNKPGLTVRPVNLQDLKTDLKYIKEIYNDSWSRNWDFAPMTDEEIDDLARQLKPIIQPAICPLVFYQGEPAGMCIALPDYNQVLKRLNGRLFPLGWLKFLLYKNRITRARLWALGVKRKFHNLGFDSLLYYESFMGAKRLGYTEGEVSWILEDNYSIIRPILMWGGRLYRTYRVYQSQL